MLLISEYINRSFIGVRYCILLPPLLTTNLYEAYNLWYITQRSEWFSPEWSAPRCITVRNLLINYLTLSFHIYTIQLFVDTGISNFPVQQHGSCELFAIHFHNTIQCFVVHHFYETFFRINTNKRRSRYYQFYCDNYNCVYLYFTIK